MVSKRGRLEGAYGYLVGGENSAPDRDSSYCLEQSEPESGRHCSFPRVLCVLFCPCICNSLQHDAVCASKGTGSLSSDSSNSLVHGNPLLQVKAAIESAVLREGVSLRGPTNRLLYDAFAAIESQSQSSSGSGSASASCSSSPSSCCSFTSWSYCSSTLSVAGAQRSGCCSARSDMEMEMPSMPAFTTPSLVC